jgi:hypothetical protein
LSVLNPQLLTEKNHSPKIESVQRRFANQRAFDTMKEFCLHGAMKWLALLLLALVQCSCSGIDDGRALYRPDALGGYGGVQTTSETIVPFRSMPPATTPASPEQSAPAKPEFRY